MAHRTFDPVGAFQGARQGALQIQAGEQDVARERAAAPIRNQLANLQLGQAQVGAQRAETQFGQQQSLQRAQILGQSASALKALPLQQRDAAFAAISPQLEQFGIDVTQFPAGSFTDENLDGVIAQAQSFITDPSKLTAMQREFGTLTEGLTKDQKLEAKLIKLGISPRAVSSADITIAESPELTQQVADSKAIIGQRKKFGELTGSSRAKTIDDAFGKIAKIDLGIGNIDRAVDALNRGAGVGAIQRFLPSFRAASVELDNIQKSMALDVIGAVTFGALSKGELDLAKQVALPTGLSTQELIQHLQRRKTAQQKLKADFNEQIQFLDQDGTVAGFLRQKEREQAQVPATFNSTALGREVSEQDIADTLQANPGLTREQLFQQLGIQQ